METLKKIANKYGMSVIHEKENFLEEIKVAKGMVNNFYASIEDEDNRFIIKINIDKNVDKNEIMEFLKSFAKKKFYNNRVCYRKMLRSNNYEKWGF